MRREPRAHSREPATRYPAPLHQPTMRDKTQFDGTRHTAASAGHTVPLYVGDALHPAHVVLVVSAEQHRLRVYEPSAGRMLRIGREAFTTSRFRLGGWSVPWFAVLPR